ncbi:hypothetical protein Kpol_543p36 [Vanderwaltozyma polyspora DSM 70294]|uniref:Actin-like protein ARP6 n=1 Tax=Vanderwaltozyma polyspora (strain ATCC 22028 / DSM 70294 / BCRC 21397 / CBS 2163 / NBRC 10782 / NRRL Y-8283 / UCD 57-17) TaxID=436907 RepID=A7THP0_VANPO|nr:uncharacterized protein Kpol_543p36 [Vanderwaltozyma polyspora DSM 70294]EDO18206.1 hypothetical protein Kpol_543p36 [Vanderwaltozyma polyspora DSM 70294]
MEQNPIVIDNGSYEVKFGYSDAKVPNRALNALAKDKYGAWYLSNQMNNIKDISSVTIRRPHELGQLVSWELEGTVWDYCFFNPDEFPNFNLKETKGHHLVVSETCMTLPELSANMDQVMFEEYEFESLFKSPVAGFVPFLNLQDNMKMICGKGDDVMGDLISNMDSQNIKNPYSDFNLVIDSGFNCTWIIPIIKGVPYYKAVKKMEMGGRFLNGLFKETISYRHYDVTDETILVNNIKEKCLFMSPTSYMDSFKNKDRYSVDYVLPDFQTSFIGYVKDKKSNSQLPENSQVITLTDELFSVPETIFHPEMAKLLKPGIVETILESLSIVPETIRPLLVNNIVCVGGNFNMPNFGSRLATELQRQLPTDWVCNIYIPEKDCELQGWKSMSQFAQNTDIYKKARISREEYYEHGTDWTTKKRFGYQNWI